jgi:tetratricopeptide (TPR) repeat protein
MDPRFMTARYRLGWLLCLCWAIAPALAAEPAIPGTDEQVDWPQVISALKQQVYERPGHAHTRHQLAIAYNNYAVTLGNQGQWATAALQLQEALRLQPDNGQFRENLSRMYLQEAGEAFQHRQTAEAAAALDKAIDLNPDLAEAYALRGELEYGRQRLKEAKAAWQRAVELDPSRQELVQRLEQVTEELPVESKFERLSQAYFDLRYEAGVERPTGFDVRDALLEARRQVGSDFALWPKYKLVVLIYSADSFRKLRSETPDWVAGQFDGKIRVPLPSTQLDQARVRQIIFHEYTHALVYDMARGHCPVWFNEGLAEYEGRSQLSLPLTLLSKAHAADKLVPWAELSGHFTTSLGAEEVAFAYEQSYSIAAYLIKRYGFWRIREVLKLVGEGRPLEDAFQQGLRMKQARLEADWRRALPELLTSAD